MTTHHTALDMFIPEDRRQALTRGDSLPARMNGVVVFADLSGFTRLTGLLSTQLGPRRGAEALTQLLDPIYTELVNSIHDYRGSVIVISGDGITCWFAGDDGSRAITCAFVMQGIITRYDSVSISGGRKVGLGIKIALSAGLMQRFLVGDPDIQLLEALGGRELDRVVSIHEVLEKGEVAISGEMLGRFRGQVHVHTLRQTPEAGEFIVIGEKLKLAERDPWPEIPALDDEVARKWVFQSIYSRIKSEEIEFLTELRQAVPLFVRFSGIEYDQDKAAGKKLDQFIRCVQSVLERYEGYLCQLTIGGETSNVFIAFGAPIAHEDIVDRALAAALELREETARLGFVQPVQIGLTHGQLWAGAHGGDAARTYSVIGSDVNLASRLVSSAEPGQILASPHVAELAPNYLFDQLTPVNFKGIEKPMAPLVLLGRTKALTRFGDRNSMLGRAMERGILKLKLTELMAGNVSETAGVVLIEGEAGIGKSRLVSDFMETANQDGARLFYGEADPVERSTQYYAFRSILETVFEISNMEDPQNNILSFIEDDAFLMERAPLLGEILPLHWMDNELTSQMSGEARAVSIQDIVIRILRNALFKSGQSVPTVLVLDDAHWMDAASWNLIGPIARELPEILLVISMRPFHEDEVGSQTMEAYDDLRNDPATQRIQLSSLSLGDMASLVEQRLGVKSVPMFVLDFIRVRSQGNPFFTEQAAFALRDAGIIHIANEEAVIDLAADELGRIDFPATVQGIITSRVDRLPPSQQLTLKVASVIGRIFILKILENLHPAKIGTDSLIEQLDSLTRIGITGLDESTSELSYLFTHIITQEVLYGLLTFAQRKQLHCRIAEWYERNYAEDLAPYYSRLAHHWLKGDVIEKAIFFLEKAGERALELFANEDVVRFISTAIALDEQNDGGVDPGTNPQRALRRAHWERMLGFAHLNMGHLPETMDHYKEALRLLGHPMPETNAQIGLNLIKELVTQAIYRMHKGKRRSKGGTMAQKMEEELARMSLGEALFFSQNVALLAWGILACLNAAERIGMSTAIADGYRNVLLIAGFVQNERLMDLYRRLTWEAVEQADRTRTRIVALLSDGMSLYISCEWELTRERFELGIQLAEQIGDTRQMANLTSSFATTCFLQGNYHESLNLWGRIYRGTVNKDRPQEQAWALQGQGHNLLMLGQIDKAIVNLEASLGVPMKGTEDIILNASLYGALSLAYLRSGYVEQSFEKVVELEKVSTAPTSASIIHFYSGWFDAILGLYEGSITGKIHLTASQAAKLGQIMGHLPRWLNTMKTLPANKASIWLYEGIYYNLMGKQKKAAAAWAKSMDFARRFKQPYELARVFYELGRSPNGDAVSRQQNIGKACEIFDRLGTSYELDLAKSVRAELTSASTD